MFQCWEKNVAIAYCFASSQIPSQRVLQKFIFLYVLILTHTLATFGGMSGVQTGVFQKMPLYQRSYVIVVLYHKGLTFTRFQDCRPHSNCIKGNENYLPNATNGILRSEPLPYVLLICNLKRNQSSWIYSPTQRKQNVQRHWTAALMTYNDVSAKELFILLLLWAT